MSKWGEKGWFRKLYDAQGTSKASAYFAHRRNGYQKHRHAKIISFFKRNVQGEPISSFLDVGCATGDFAATFIEQTRVEHGAGIDFLDEAVRTASAQYPQLTFRTATLPDIPFVAGSFDLAVASEVLYYLDDVDRKATMQSLAQVLRPRGLLIFTAALGPSYFTPESARALVDSTFDVLAEEYDYARWYHRFIFPFERLHRLHETMRAPESYGEGRLSRTIMARPRLYQNAVIVGCVGFLAAITSFVFAWQWIPAMLSGAAEIFSNESARSNIMILARARPDRLDGE